MKEVLKRLAIAMEESLLAVLFVRQCKRREAFYTNMYKTMTAERDPVDTLPVLATLSMTRPKSSGKRTVN